MNVSSSLGACRAARVPRERLGSLGRLRRLKSIRISEGVDFAWIFWESALPSIIEALLPVPGVVLYCQNGEHWRPLGASLPDFAAPKSDGHPVDAVVLPAPVAAKPAPDFRGKRMMVRLVPAQVAQSTTALRCDLDALRPWADTATSLEIGRLSGAVCGRRVWLRGERLPALAGAERFWGKSVLIPLGLRTEPDWPEGPLRWAARVDDDEILVVTADDAEALPAAAFQPLTRAGVRRLALA